MRLTTEQKKANKLTADKKYRRKVKENTEKLEKEVAAREAAKEERREQERLRKRRERANKKQCEQAVAVMAHNGYSKALSTGVPSEGTPSSF